MPKPDDPRHAALEADIVIFLKSIGCCVDKAGYVDVYSKDVSDALRCTGDIDQTSNFVRHQKDLIAVKGRRSLLLDAKTMDTWFFEKENDFAIDVIPLVSAARHFDDDVKTLFCCRYADGHEFGLFPSKENLAAVRCVWFPPDRYPDSKDVRYLWGVYKKHFPHIYLPEREPIKGGSKDAFAVFRYSRVREFLSWQALIKEYFA